MNGIASCPFCGSSASYGEIGDDFMPPHPYQGWHFIKCTNNACGATTNLRFACGEDPKLLLLEQWNTRTYGGIDELRSAINSLLHAFDHMRFNSPRERDYDAKREAERVLNIILPLPIWKSGEEDIQE